MLMTLVLCFICFDRTYPRRKIAGSLRGKTDQCEKLKRRRWRHSVKVASMIFFCCSAFYLICACSAVAEMGRCPIPCKGAALDPAGVSPCTRPASRRWTRTFLHNLSYGVNLADLCAFSAACTFFVIYDCMIVFHLDRSCLTVFLAKLTAYTTAWTY